MRLSDFDFHLPEDRIALRPAQPRDSARLLVVRPGEAFEDRIVRDLPDLLRAGDALVFNDTRVIPARLAGRRVRGESVVAVEATLHKRLAPDRWAAFMRPGKRLALGDRVVFLPPPHGEGRTRGADPGGELAHSPPPGASRHPPQEGEGEGLHATVAAKGEGGEVTLAFDLAGAALDRAVALHGVMPLPPYIASKRGEDDRDRSDYQTVYAREDGSVAAPTAGLHFTPKLLSRLEAAGIERLFVTLHVGAGTFLPVKTDDVSEHRMHAERGVVSLETAEALNAVRARGGRIVCVGTTSLRLIESAADPDGTVRPWVGETEIFITPGHRVRAADALMTNFHLPKSTLFMLVSAFAGTETMKAAYARAIETGYRFYSYGDSSLLFRSPRSARPGESRSPEHD